MSRIFDMASAWFMDMRQLFVYYLLCQIKTPFDFSDKSGSGH